MKILIIISSIFLTSLLFSISNVFAQADSEHNFCIRNDSFINENCNKIACLSVNFEIFNGYKIPQQIVGDYFWYNISLSKIGNRNLDFDDISVNIINPDKDYLGNRTYVNISLNQNFLYPNISSNNHEVFSSDLQGTYKIILSTSKPSKLFRFYPSSCFYVEYSNSITYSFDAEPNWQYQNQQNLSATINSLLKTEESLIDQQTSFQSSQSNFTNKLIILTEEVGNLTVVIIILSFFTLIGTTLEIIRKNKHIFIGLQGFGLAGFLFYIIVYNLKITDILNIVFNSFLGILGILMTIGSIYIFKERISKKLFNFALSIILFSNVILAYYGFQQYSIDKVISISIILTSLFFLIIIFVPKKELIVNPK